MQKISTMRVCGKNALKGQLTVGLDLGDRSSSYWVLNETGEIVFEHKLPTTQEAMKQVFARMPRSRIAMETGTHSPWISRLWKDLVFIRIMIETHPFCSTAGHCLTKLRNGSNVRNSPFKVVSLNS
jgi:hypothetical protein